MERWSAPEDKRGWLELGWPTGPDAGGAQSALLTMPAAWSPHGMALREHTGLEKVVWGVVLSPNPTVAFNRLKLVCDDW